MINVMLIFLIYNLIIPLNINIDLETVKLSVDEYFNLLIHNNILSILNFIVVEEKTEDNNFLVSF